MQLSRLRPLNLSSFIFFTNTKEFASFCLCVLYSGRSTVHAETPSSRICDKRFFHCGPYIFKRPRSHFSQNNDPSLLYLLLYYCRPHEPFLALTGLVDTASIRSSIEHNTFWQHPEHPNVTSRVN